MDFVWYNWAVETDVVKFLLFVKFSKLFEPMVKLVATKRPLQRSKIPWWWWWRCLAAKHDCDDYNEADDDHDCDDDGDSAD